MFRPILFLLCLSIIVLATEGCQKEKIGKSGSIDDFFYLKNQGQQLPVRVIGNIDSKKLLFIIHGGPGGNGLEYRDEYINKHIESEFAVVYWDQRFSGNSQGNNGSSTAVDFANDIKKIIQILRYRYGNDQKVYLMGHSWGGFLAPFFLLQNDNQQLVEGWIQIGGGHNYELNDSLTKQMLLYYGQQELNAGNHTDFWKEVVDWCNTHSHLGSSNASQLNSYAHSAEEKFSFIVVSDETKAMKSHFSKLVGAVNGLISTWLKIDQQAYQIPNSDNLNKIKLPTLLLWGKYDFVCPEGLATDVQSNIGSTDVSKIIYNSSGHSPMVNEPQAFWNDVKNWVKTH